MAENIKAKTKKQKKIRVVPIKEARYVKAVLLLPKEIVSELLKSIYHPLTSVTMRLWVTSHQPMSFMEGIER